MYYDGRKDEKKKKMTKLNYTNGRRTFCPLNDFKVWLSKIGFIKWTEYLAKVWIID